MRGTILFVLLCAAGVAVAADRRAIVDQVAVQGSPPCEVELKGKSSAVRTNERNVDALVRKQVAAMLSKGTVRSGDVKLVYKPSMASKDSLKGALQLRKALPKWWQVRLPEVEKELEPGAYEILDWTTYSSFLGHDDWLLVRGLAEPDAEARWLVLRDRGSADESIDFEFDPAVFDRLMSTRPDR